MTESLGEQTLLTEIHPQLRLDTLRQSRPAAQ
jgi:hypothetical protein